MKFESRYYTTKEMYKEYIFKVLCKHLTILGIIVAVCAFLLSVIFINESKLTVGLMLGAGIISLLTAIFTPYVTLKQLLDLDSKLHSGVKYEVVVTFDDKITLTEGAQTISVDYSQIIKYHKLKTCSVLMFSNQNGVMFDENHFTVGNKEDFDKFIHEKCENLR
ncbi:MAG: YcxB family protein [Clostridia bacterium]|nr:YcxB family protein [Clostridia bacterium]